MDTLRVLLRGPDVAPEPGDTAMIGQTKARAVAAAPGEAVHHKTEPVQFNGKLRRPPYSRQFKLGPRQAAIVCIGWPPHPPAPWVLALPPGESPQGFDWTALHDADVMVTPAPGTLAEPETLLELGAALIRDGARSLVLFNGEEIAGEWWRFGSERPLGGAP